MRDCVWRRRRGCGLALIFCCAVGCGHGWRDPGSLIRATTQILARVSTCCGLGPWARAGEGGRMVARERERVGGLTLLMRFGSLQES